MQLIDTHVHLNFDVFQGDLEALRERWHQAGVVRLVHSCVEPNEFEQIQTLADHCPELSFAVGLHPLDAGKWTAQMSAQIIGQARSDKRVVAIGETGLDFYKADNLETQKLAFTKQLAIASELDKPVIIHCREAAAAMVEIISQCNQHHSKPIRGVMHCWAGTPEETKQFLDLGFYISFSGIVTFKGAKQVQASAAIVPNDRILIETDCPFLAPVPKRGKRNEPANVKYVAQQVAAIRGVPLEQLAQQTTNNACELFDLDLS